MKNNIKKIAVTGGGGQIAYSLLFKIANGDLLGENQPISLSILDTEEKCSKDLKGIVMELEDCHFPLLKEIHINHDPKKAFEDANYAILIGAKPRTLGMERNDLLLQNASIFKEQGKALNEVAAKDILVFVVGNPCNTNCLITMKNAPNIPSNRFHAMTRLDQNRMCFQLAKKANCSIEDIKNAIIWGNHSNTLVADFHNALIKNSPVSDVIKDHSWLRNEFLQIIQQRGAAVIKERGRSSAASAAKAIVDAIKDLITPTPENKYFSTAMHSKNNPYGIDEDLIFSFPCICKEKGKYEIVPNLAINEFIGKKLKITEQELLKEKETIKNLL